MQLLSFHSPTWYNALTLAERMTLLRGQRSSQNINVNADRAGLRMRRWRSQEPFLDGASFAQRLAMDQMSEEVFLYLLGETGEAIRDRCETPPPWLVNLSQAFSESFPSLPEKVFGPPAWFVEVIEPLLAWGRDCLHQGVQRLAQTQTQSDLPFNLDTVEALLFGDLPQRLSSMLIPTMLLELNVKRLQRLLNGDTPERRFRNFLEGLRQRDAILTLLEEYPVLARQLITSINQWALFSLEFLQHLCGDWKELRQRFSPKDDPGVLAALAGMSEESHRAGRRVQLAKFTSGLQVVYKPRALAVDLHFQELLSWINRRGMQLPFRILNILDRGTHGWVEFVTAQTCTSAREVAEFYQRQGAYLAVLYALEATDCYAQNLIAASSHPVLIDLETLFHPRVGDTEPDELTPSVLAHSVLRVGFLPQQLYVTDESDGVDLSALGTRVDDQLSAYALPQVEGAGTDEMRLIRKRVPMPTAKNRPSLNGIHVDVLDYANEIVNGFTAMYRFLLQSREELLADDGPLARFSKDSVRVVLRSTKTYWSLLRESFHPDALRDALDRDRLFDRLWASVESFPYFAKVIPYERDDLQNGDIPIFTTRPGSCDLWSSSKEQIHDFFSESGMTLVDRRFHRLSDADLERQLWFIRASLATLSKSKEWEQRTPYRLAEAHAKASRAQLLAGAQAVGDRLAATALHGRQGVSWIGLLVSNRGHWSVDPLDIDLYDGLAGVALFLAHLGSVSGGERYSALAQTVLATIRGRLKWARSYMTSIGAFTGWGGLIYVLAHLGALWNQPALFAEAEELVDMLPPLIERDNSLDIIAGAAGCIGGLLSLYRCSPSERILAAAVQCGDRLIAGAQPMEHGIGWVLPGLGSKAQTGFAHGAAGMAWALIKLTAVTQQERFRTAAFAAIAYERSLFSSKAGNWPDLRELAASGQVVRDEEQTFATLWCHGAPGIGLARLDGLPSKDDATTRAEICAALQTSLARGFGLNHSLCHGDLGNLELLLMASITLDQPEWTDWVNRIAAAIMESITRNGWLCGNPGGVESPGLMTGLAGIGYGLLRLAEPARVPSVLVLAPPCDSV